MDYVHKLISRDLAEQIEDMVKRVKEFFGLDITGVQASKIISWKSKSYNLTLTEKKLLEILRGKVQ